MKNVGIFLLGFAALNYSITFTYIEIGYYNLEREQWDQMP
jgi:hypothetical protein